MAEAAGPDQTVTLNIGQCTLLISMQFGNPVHSFECLDVAYTNGYNGFGLAHSNGKEHLA